MTHPVCTWERYRRAAPNLQRQTARVRMTLPATSAVVKIAHFEKTLSVKVDGTGGDPGNCHSNAGDLPAHASAPWPDEFRGPAPDSHLEDGRNGFRRLNRGTVFRARDARF